MNQFLVVQLTEACHPAVHPVFLWLVRGQLDGQDVVGRVAGGGQRPSAGAGFVNRTNVQIVMYKFGHFSWFELDDGQGVKEDLGEGLSDHHVLSVPASPLHEKTLNVGPFLGLLIHMSLLFGDLECNPERENPPTVMIRNDKKYRENLAIHASNSKPM